MKYSENNNSNSNNNNNNSNEKNLNKRNYTYSRYKRRRSSSDNKIINEPLLNTPKKEVAVSELDKKKKGLNNNRSRKGRRYSFRTKITMKEICSICKNEINDIAFSLSMKVDKEDKPVHFDCVLNKLKNENALSETEKIVYKGIGKFIIVDTSVRGTHLAFKIVNEIDFERLESRPEWRKEVFEQLNKGFNFY